MDSVQSLQATPESRSWRLVAAGAGGGAKLPVDPPPGFSAGLHDLPTASREAHALRPPVLGDRHLPAGAEMKAYLAMFLTFREDKIVSQRQYDCYPPLGEAFMP